MSKKIIIADTSPLIAFSRINLLNLLSEIFGQVIITETVMKEYSHDLTRKDAQNIHHAVNKIKIIKMHQDPDNDLFTKLSEILGKGEASAITLALELKSPLLIDDRLGRQIAEKHHIKIIGTAGVLLIAKKKKLIRKVKPLITDLTKSGIYISDSLIQEILKRAKE